MQDIMKIVLIHILTNTLNSFIFNKTRKYTHTNTYLNYIDNKFMITIKNKKKNYIHIKINI